MTLPQHIAKLFRAVYHGGNWTSVNLKDALSDITWHEATRQVQDFNTIAALVYHMNYYVQAVHGVLKGNPLDAHDRFSFQLQPINGQADWEALLHKTWSDAEAFATAVEQLPESRLWETFVAEKYGTYYRNLHGVIEHNHYHLGQIILIRKLTAGASIY